MDIARWPFQELMIYTYEWEVCFNGFACKQYNGGMVLLFFFSRVEIVVVKPNTTGRLWGEPDLWSSFRTVNEDIYCDFRWPFLVPDIKKEELLLLWTTTNIMAFPSSFSGRYLARISLFRERKLDERRRREKKASNQSGNNSTTGSKWLFTQDELRKVTGAKLLS